MVLLLFSGCNVYLVDGVDGVDDAALTASGHMLAAATTFPASRAKLSAREVISPNGTLASSWCAAQNRIGEWLQVKYREYSIISLFHY